MAPQPPNPNHQRSNAGADSSLSLSLSLSPTPSPLPPSPVLLSVYDGPDSQPFCQFQESLIRLKDTSITDVKSKAVKVGRRSKRGAPPGGVTASAPSRRGTGRRRGMRAAAAAPQPRLRAKAPPTIYRSIVAGCSCPSTRRGRRR